MTNKQLYCIANWKMYFSWKESCIWIDSHEQGLTVLSEQVTLVICPSFEALASCTQSKKTFFIGAQDCSENNFGAYTSQVAAASLQTIGVTYCLVGHSETRKAYNLTNNILYKKLEQCIQNNLIAIFCIGETTHFDNDKLFFDFLQDQLEPLKKAINQYPDTLFLVAYEPIWAIGTGNVADNAHITKALIYCKDSIAANKVVFLYGGTVNSQTIQTLRNIPLLDGVLIGKASTDFQELKKIVSWLL